MLALVVLVAATTPLVAQERFAEVDQIIAAGIASRVFPGAVIVVGRTDSILYSKGYGHYAWQIDSRVPDPGWSLWDVASLTKVVATASASALLFDRGRLDLSLPVYELVPRFAGGDKDLVTFRMLLDHTSGLPAWVRLSEFGADRVNALATLFDVPLSRPPDESSLYSDLNAIIAAMAIERLTGRDFAQFTRDSVFRPTGMWNATWRPSLLDQLRAVPSQLLPDGSAILGTVNDGNAAVLGGVAGHAGVFATGTDLAHFAQAWLAAARGTDSSWIRPATARRFFERTEQAGTRALGWDTPRLQEEGVTSLYGRCATGTTWGHTGFTGTLLWLDTEADLFVVFLTNRSYQPNPHSMSEIREARTRVSDAVRRAVVGHCR